jgi:hypothetical protein
LSDDARVFPTRVAPTRFEQQDVLTDPSLTSLRTISFAAFLAVAPAAVGAQPPAAQHISGTKRVGAAVISGYIGLGIGHNIIGYGKVAEPFRYSQLGGLAAMLAGLALGFSGCDAPSLCTSNDAGEAMFVVGLVAYLGSRVWEFIDVLVRPFAHNAGVDKARRDSGISEAASVNLVPVINGERRGLGLAIRVR